MKWSRRRSRADTGRGQAAGLRAGPPGAEQQEIAERRDVPDARRILGDTGERLAEQALVRHGWRVIERNARTRYGEIDLVCHDGRSFVFVEVKTRRSSSFVSAVEAAGPRKLARLEHLAESWLALKGRRTAAWRIAVVAVTVWPQGADLEIINAEE
jgi:putative endonuclease